MASNLYEVLEVKKDATVEQIRKAYKKKALRTHPDKLPQGLSEEEKNIAGDKFREIGHAYEILSDPEKRKEYDIHGVWPPPQPEEDDFEPFFDNTFPGRQRGHRSHTFPSPFFAHHHHHSYSNFAFRDPFELFNALFQDMGDMFGSPVHTFTPFGPFGGMHSHRSQSLLSNSFFGPVMPALSLDPFGSAHVHGPRGSASESFVSTTVNGVTQTIHTRRDQDGNEHVTRTYPDGREVHTINGIEQPARGYLPQNSHEPQQITSPPSNRYAEPNQPRHQHRSSSQSYISSRPVQPHPRYNNNTYDVPTPGHHRYTVPTPPRHEYDVSPPPYSGGSSMHRDNYQRSYNRASGADRPMFHGRERRATDKYPQTAHIDHTRDDDRHHRNWLHRSSRHT